jgi:regulator of sigma E protease
MVVIAAGPAMNLLLAFVLLFAYLAFIGPRNPEKASGTVDAIEKGYPAEKALKPGDRIISIDSVSGGTSELSEAVAAHKCPGAQTDDCRAAQPARVVIERDGEMRTLELRPKYDAHAEPEPRARLGFAYLNDGPHETFAVGTAFTETADRLWLLTKETVKLPARLLDAEKRKDISGVVGSYEFTRQTILDDLADVLGILAVISLSLAIVNLFPFLPLDGGHIFWAIVEGVRRRPVPFAVMERSGVIGFMLVIGLFLIGLTNDIDRLQGEGFEVR